MKKYITAGILLVALFNAGSPFAAEPGEAAGESAGSVAVGSTTAVGLGAVAAIAGVALAASGGGNGSQTGTTTTTTTSTSAP
ncbi:MAG: exopolysaccharide production protein YjbE [Pantoea sp.]|uniref:exopolysaccharide production protein YjbE n=1 Tax=Pantoea sp. TaxID=69393 RepID=UPI0039E39E19